MGKLSASMASKRHLEKKYGKSQLLPVQMQEQLKQAGESANEKIRLNNTVYTQSNSRSHETVVQERTIPVIGQDISDAESVMSGFMEKLDNGTFKKDTEPHSNGILLDETFIKQRVESYNQLLQSGMIDQAIESEKGHAKTKS